MIRLQAVLKSHGARIYTKPPRAPFSCIVPFRNRAQIVTAEVRFSNNFMNALANDDLAHTQITKIRV